jgi:hypothetical protein
MAPHESYLGECHIAKDIAHMLIKFHKKTIKCPDVTAECFKKFAECFWMKDYHKHFEKVKKTAKKLAKTAVCYSGCCCDIGKKVCTKIMQDLIFVKLKTNIKIAVAEKKKEGPKKCCECPKMLKKQLKCKEKMQKLEALVIATTTMKERCEDVKLLIETVKATVDEFTKDIKECTDCCRKKATIKAAHFVFHCVWSEKIEKAKIQEHTLKFLKEMYAPCPKECVKKCQKIFKIGAQLHGLVDKDALHVMKKWGAMNCCHVNAKNRCCPDAMMPFAAEFLKKNVPVVSEAINGAREVIKANKICEHMNKYWIKNMLRKRVLGFLAFEGKFDKGHFAAWFEKKLTDYKNLSEKLAKPLCEKP